MATHTFTIFEVDEEYYDFGTGYVLGSDFLTITDDDSLLHATQATDTGTAQSFDFASEPAVVSYEVLWREWTKIKGVGPEFEIYVMDVSFVDGVVKYYVISTDADFAPTVGQELNLVTGGMSAPPDYGDFPPPVCLTAGTLVACPGGSKLVENLKPGDLVLTLDHGPQPLRHCLMRQIGPAALRAAPALRPVLIREGTTLGAEGPVLVSQQHRVFLRLGTERSDEVFVSARHLAEATPRLARIAHGKRHVTYVHLLFDRHEVIFAGGVALESFYPGPMALRSGERALEEELRLLFPGFLAEMLVGLRRDPVGGLTRPVINGRSLAARLSEGGVPRPVPVAATGVARDCYDSALN